MSSNLISLASQYLRPDLLDGIAAEVGADTSVVGKACGAAIPALLSSFANIASSNEGARKLTDAIGQQNPAILNSLAATIGTAKQQDLVDGGIRSLGSLLGNASVSALAGALARFAGLGQSSSSSIVGLLGSIVLGLLGKQTAEAGLDANGLARLLTSQKDNFAAAMPAGFQGLLQATGFPFAPEKIQPSAPTSAWAASSTPGRPEASSPQRSWLVWLIPLIALGAISWWLFNSRIKDDHGLNTQVNQAATPEVPRKVEQTQMSADQPTQEISAAATNLTSATRTALNGVKSTLEGITDEASAKTALPKLEAATSEFERIVELSRHLPSEAKTALAALVTAVRPALENSFQAVLAIPGVNSVAKPAIETLREKLELVEHGLTPISKLSRRDEWGRMVRLAQDRTNLGGTPEPKPPDRVPGRHFARIRAKRSQNESWALR